MFITSVFNLDKINWFELSCNLSIFEEQNDLKYFALLQILGILIMLSDPLVIVKYTSL